MSKRIVMLILVLLIFFMAGNGAVYAAEFTECIKCHDFKAKPSVDIINFNLHKVNDGSIDGSVVDKTTCIACHKSYLAPLHVSKIPTQLVSVNNVVYGAFQGPLSLYLPAGSIHLYHAGISTQITGPTCIKCHGVVSCYSCHNKVSHKDHYNNKPINPNTNLPITTPVLTVVTGEVRNENGNILPDWNIATSCAASECHGQLPKVLRKKEDTTDLCFNCHRTGTTGHSNVSSRHVSNFVNNPPINCAGCHNNVLNTEHELHQDNAGKAYDCFTCHTSVLDDVKNAIMAGTTQCSDCHSKFDHAGLHVNNLDNNCQTCHKGDFVTEHLYNSKTQNNALTCGTCHNNDADNIKSAIAQKENDCAACHNEAHNMYIVKQIPSDIPLYPGTEWSAPMEAGIWAGETWFNDYYVNGKIVFSARRNVSDNDVWNYYNTELTEKGWKLISAQPNIGDNYFKVEYAKDNRKVLIWFYGGENHADSPLVSTGFRIEIIYY